jgi:serine/threonine protein kinase
MAADPRRVKELFVAALDMSDSQDREDFLDRECGGDVELRQRLAALLKAHEGPVAALSQPLAGANPDADPAEMGIFANSAEQPGTVLAGRYKLLEQIGEGGMGAVWVAEQTQPVRRKVAVKLIKAGMDSKSVLSRFEAERQALALMDHPHIAKVFDGGTTESGRPFFVMEYVKGVPFSQYCDNARLSIAERLALFVPVCQAVQHAHQKGIIHRDLKPSNILVCLYDGKPVPKVIDFGLAKAMHQPLTEHTLHTSHGVLMGTPLYMSPEQAEFNNLDVDTRTDIYALGVILYELLTGTTPLEKQRFKQAAWQEMLRIIKEEEPQRPSARLSGSGSLPSVAAQRQLEPVKLARLLRGELDWIVLKCLEKDRSRRYETANGFARDVERYLADEAVEACPPSMSYRLKKLVRRNRGRVIAGSAFVAILFLVAGLVLYGVWWTERQAAQRRHEHDLSAARVNDAFNATLNQIEAALKEGRLAEAGTLLGEAEKQSAGALTDDLRERRARLKRDNSTVRELDDIFEERWMVSPSDTRLDSKRAKKRYPLLFESFGLAVGAEPAADTVAKLRQSIIAEALSSALTEWFFVDPKYPGLLAVVDLLDRDPGRAALRAAIVHEENDRVKEIGRAIDGSRLAPAYAIGLGTHPSIEDGLRILKAAWWTHPQSFPLALTISSHLYGRDEKTTSEKIGWGRTAVALRPNNPLAHYYYAIALSGKRGLEVESAAVVNELRRTIELAPRFAKAYARLAFVLYSIRGRGAPGEWGSQEAADAARTAIQLDKESILAHFVLYLHLLINQKDYPEAARVSRRLDKLLSAGVDSQADEASAEAYVMGGRDVSFSALLEGLVDTDRSFEAYRLVLDGHPPGEMMILIVHSPSSCGHFLAARAAALAGTGQGIDAPPPNEGPAIRKHALEWLSTSLGMWKKDATGFPVLGARTMGLLSSPLGHGPLLVATAAPSPGSPYAPTNRATDWETIHDGMNDWLGDAKLTGVRDDPWLAKLPADERDQWRKFWSEVRALRDQTDSPKMNKQPDGP